MSEMFLIKVIFLMASLHISSCIETIDHEKCKDRFGANLNENFALLKTATQTSTKGDAVASRAVDGNTNPYFGNLSCSETEPGNPLVWKVELGQDIYLTSVTITTRMADQNKVNPDFYHVYSAVPEWKCSEGIFPNTGESITTTCVIPKKTNAVEIRLFQIEGILSLCEVEVHGWKFNHYKNEVNFALHQTGRLSSVFTNHPAELALDGDHNTDFSGGSSCMHTANAALPSFWSVDLGKIMIVTALTLTSVDAPNVVVRVSDFVIRVGMADVAEDENYQNCAGRILGFGNAETRTFFCTNPIRGRYVIIVSFFDTYFHLCEVTVHGNDQECAFPQALGMETFKIHDSQLSASSVLDSNDIYGPQNARLNFHRSNSPKRFPCWVAKNTDTEPWIEVDLLWLSTVSGVLTQGRYELDQWVKSFSVSSKVDGKNFQFYVENNERKIFMANIDRNSIVRQTFWPYVVARWIRIHPVSCFGYCSMRMELTGCQNGLQGSRPPQALGMTNGKILDGQLSASSSDDGWEPKYARLNLNVNGWVATTPDSSWLQVELFLKSVVLEIQTQGSGRQPFWIKTYQISYASHSQFFFPYMQNGVQKTFVGNTDQQSIVTQRLLPAIVAKLIRIHPISWEQKTGLRVEFIGYYRENSIPRALGMQNHFINDWQLSYSTVIDMSVVNYRSPWLLSQSGCWIPNYNSKNQWLQVNFLRSTKVTRIKTQGRPWISGEQWVVSYELSFGDDGSFFKFYRRNGEIREFTGNWDISSVNSQTVFPAIVSQFLRIHPKAINNQIGLRVEFEGSYIGFRDSCHTSGPLGMEDRIINVHQISASSYFNKTTSPDHGRLNMKNENGSFGAWVSALYDTNQWYQVDFERIIKLIEIDTQGQTAPGNQEYWVKEYIVSYGYDPERADAQFYKQSGQTKVFQGNNDTDSIVRNTLLPAIIARVVRLHIRSWNIRIAMRVEFVGTYEDPHGPSLIDPDYVALENRLTASSFLDHRHQPIHGIISDKINATSWTPLEDKRGEYIQVDLLQLTPISGVGLRTGGDQPNDSYVEVMMQYRDAEGPWSTLRDYRGETKILSTADCDTEFEKLVVARYVRLVITGYGSRTGFVFQLYGTKEFHRPSAGIESGLIKDNQMKSSNHPNDPYPAYEARLNYRGAWCGNTLRRYLYLQVDFLSNFEVNAVATQPKAIGITESVTRYKLASTLDGKNWTFYLEESRAKIFEGNTSCHCTRKHLVRPFLVRSVRFHPTSWKKNPCMRVDVYGVYKGILQIQVRSGKVLDDHGTELTNSSSIKLNGKDVSKSNDGINVVIANYKTGDLVSSNSAADYPSLNNLLRKIENDSIVVLATQNVHERASEDTLQLLQSLGGIKLRYSLTSEQDPWILVGYKGKQKADWITVKVGKKDKTAIRVSTTVHLNQIPNFPELHEYFTSAESSTTNRTELSIAGRYSHLVHNITTRCEVENTNCQPSLSLAMWMKSDHIPSISNKHTSRPTQYEERFVFKYYSNGYRYIIPNSVLLLKWDDSHRFCLTLGAHLPVLLDRQTEDAMNLMVRRAGVVPYRINIGLRRDPVTSKFKWVDGSRLEYINWFETKPNTAKCVSRFDNAQWDSLSCTGFNRPTVCQQSIEDHIGLVPLGLENNVIRDGRMTSSSAENGFGASDGRINMKDKSWCAKSDDKEPYLQVDLGVIRSICGVGTQGRDFSSSWPKSYRIKLSNDSSTWIDLERGGWKEEFLANYDGGSTVIHRFHQPVITQLIRLEVLDRAPNQLACARMELFACSSKGKEDKRPALDVPKTITVTEPEHCLDVLMSGRTTDGVYMINPGNGAFPVYCDQTTDGGGWTVFQRRMDGTIDFYRNLEEYVAGFGDISGEYWLGLSKIALLTHSYSSDLRVDLSDWNGGTFDVVYSNFMIDAERSSYKLRYSHWLGPGVDDLKHHKDATFNTKDRGTFKYTAVKYHSGWWFNKDGWRAVSLNGLYYDREEGHGNGIKWVNWRATTLKQSKMMIRWNGKGGKQGPLELADWHTYKSSELEAVNAKLDGPEHFTIDQVTAKYIQADIFTQRRLTHISTQAGKNSDFVNKYYLQLSNGIGYWTDYKENGVLKIFEGNNEATRVVTNCLKETELTRMVRLYPTKCKGSCSLRIEIYSCLESCSKAAGVQDRDTISDKRMTATSWDNGPHKGRLHYTENDAIQSWKAKRQMPDQYLEIWLRELYKVTSVATQGGADCWVKSFSISYRDKDMKWKQYKNGDTFPGNRNANAVLRTYFDRPFLAYMVRFVVKTWHNFICMRTEVYGCLADNPVFVVHTQKAIAGKDVVIKGKYRYCEHCECPGCLKSLWLRVFGQVHLAAAVIIYDCQYHEFEIPVSASIVSGSHKIYMGASESSNFSPDQKLLDERMVGSITVTDYYSSCLDLLLSGQTINGVYKIQPDSQSAFEVYCDQETFGGGWTVFQRRVSGTENFDRVWADYKTGFGNLSSDFWLGNEHIHGLTIRRSELLLDLNSNSADHAFILYKSFQVENEATFYKLHVSEYQQSVGDCFGNHDGMKFSTKDQDQDDTNDHCAATSLAGWWYKACVRCQLNGQINDSAIFDNRLKMRNWQGQVTLLEKSEMKLRDRDVVTCSDQYCYYLLKSALHWSAAREKCESFKADLLSVHDATENQWVVNNILKNQTVDRVHLGIENLTHWIDDSGLLYNNFQGSNYGDGCPYLGLNGSWSVGDCGHLLPTLCKRVKFCYKEACHLFTTEIMDYTAAKGFCRARGYNIAKINSPGKNEYIANVMNSLTITDSWIKPYIGLQLSGDEHLWFDGSRPTYENWMVGEPNNNLKECVQMVQSGAWSDTPCSSAKAPVCEKVYNSAKNPIDCLDLLISGSVRSGVYTIDPDGEDPISVYCDQENFGGGWTVLMRRVSSVQSFNLAWNIYKRGFGSLDQEFWLGNDNIHRLTRITNEVLFHLKSDAGDLTNVHYKSFKVDDESESYRLTVRDYQTSPAGDAMAVHHNMKFSTHDVENDLRNSANCAKLHKGGWWYNGCGNAFLTAEYGSESFVWNFWASNKRMDAVNMKIRSKFVVSCTDYFCYYRMTEKKSWFEAVKMCRKFNADLISIHGESDQQWIIDNILVPRSLEEIYIGLGMENSKTWTDGNSFSFTKLVNAVPADKCVILKKDGSWEIVDCAQPKYVLCKRGKFCFKGDCYVVDATTQRGYEKCKEYCRNIGFSFAKITDDVENSYVGDLVKQSTADSSFSYSFIGLIQDKDDKHHWEDNTWCQYSNWKPGQPNGLGQLITAIYLETNGRYEWHDWGDGYEVFFPICERGPIIERCTDLLRHGGRENGFYSVSAGGTKRFTVYCDLNSPGNPWTVIQRRLEGSAPTDYHSKSWTEYKNGFSSDEMNFWLGNEYIHQLTKTPQRLKIVIKTNEFNLYEAVYENFTVGDEASGYQMNFGTYSGNAGDSFSRHRGMRFSTIDNDTSSTSCTSSHPGGWWFADCVDSNLNGAFTSANNSNETIFWKTIKEDIIKTEMKLQPLEEKASHTQWFSGAIHLSNASLGISFTTESTEIKVRTSSEEWTTRVPSPGPFLSHVAVTWDENGHLRYYENGSLLREDASVHLSPADEVEQSITVYRQYVWLNELKLWNSVLSEDIARIQHSTRNFTFDEGVSFWTFENASEPYSWNTSNSCSRTEFTGPCGDHTYLTSLGTFVFTEASRPAQSDDRALLTSPNLPGSNYRCLKFWFHMMGEKFGSLNIHVSRETNFTSTLNVPVLHLVGRGQGNRWNYAKVDLDISNVFKIIIEAVRGDGSKADVAVDDVMLTAEGCQKECHPPCKIGERCDLLSLECIHEGYYDHRWRLDSLHVEDDKDSKHGKISGNVQLQTDGIFENCTALRDDGRIELRTFERGCYYAWCFPFQTLSFWLKYEEVDFQNIISFGKLINITQNAQTPENDLSVEVNTAYQSCSTSISVPSEVWAHVIVSVNALEGKMIAYVDGIVVSNNSRFSCVNHSNAQTYNEVSLTAGGGSDSHFSLDDVHLLFDVLEESETVESYKKRTGVQQKIFVKAQLTEETWSEDLLNDESEKYQKLVQLIKTKFMETLQDRSRIKDVVVERFIQGSVIADINVIYEEVNYQDIILIEEALNQNYSLNGLKIKPLELNSSSVPNDRPTILVVVKDPKNVTNLYLNWTEVRTDNLNGVPQGYKIIYRITENTTENEYTAETSYGNSTEITLSDLDWLTNYTIRVLAFTLSGDGFISDSVTVMTLDGAPEATNITVTNISSTSLYVNWTMLPNSTLIYKQLKGYQITYWKESEEDKIYNLTQFENYFLLKDLEMWTSYCVNVTAFTHGNTGPTETQCARTLEDAPQEPPRNFTVLNVNITAIEMSWLPPIESAVPGIIRHYNLSYRILNESSSELTSLTLKGSTLKYVINGLPALSYVQINISAFTILSGPKQSIMALTDEGVPLIAPNLTATNISSTSFKLQWTGIPKIFHNGIFLGFHLYLWKHKSGIASAENKTYQPAVGLDQFDGVDKWTIYCAQVAGFTAIGDGVQSSVECTRTFEDAPMATPSSFIATDVQISTIDLSWSPPPSPLVPGVIRRYNLTYRNLNYTNEFLTKESLVASVKTHRMENLIGLTLYEMNITAITILPGPWTTLYVLTIEGVPSIAPPNATWTNTSSTSIRVDWSEFPKHLINGILRGYRAFIWKESDGPASKFTVDAPPEAVSASTGNLEKYTTYCGQVEAFTKVGEGPKTPVGCIRTSEDAVETAPGSLNISNITWNECHLSWGHVNLSFVPGVLRAYRVTYRIIDPRFDQSNTTFFVDSQFNTTVVTGLIGFVDYEIMVNGFTVKDAPISISYFKTKEGVPTSPPTGFLSIEKTVTTIKIVWQEIPLPARHGIITGYKVTYKKTAPRSKREVEKTLTFDADTHSAFFFKLVAYTNYTITVRGRTSKGYGAPGEIIVETLQGTPNIAPKGFYGVNFTGPTSIFVGWGSLSVAELQGLLVSYEVKYQAFSVADEELLEPQPVKVIIVHGVSVKITGLSTYTTYKVSIRAISGGGKGVISTVLYVATCRCHKTFTTNFWNLQPYVNISASGHNKDRGFFPDLLDMVTLSCCQNCLEHGTTDINYFRDGEGKPSEKQSDIDVKRSVTLATDYSFPVYGFFGQTIYAKYYGYSAIVDVVGTVFFALKPASSVQGNALMASILSTLPFLAIAVAFSYIAGLIIWALERKSNDDEFSPSFCRGAGCGFWWAYISMTTVGYGDKTARTLGGRIFAVIWVLAGLVIGSLLIGSIASAFTSSTAPPPADMRMLYGAKVAALQDSPDHKLGVRRNAKVNQLKKYRSLDELRKAVLSKEVDGLLVDSYIADSRKQLFSDLSMKQVIDVQSSYGVVMGADASKLRKCIKKYWVANAAMKTQYIQDQTNPVVVTEVSAEEAMEETFTPEGKMYKLTLIICIVLLCVGTICGFIYETVRRKRKITKVKPENVSVNIRNCCQQELSKFQEKVHKTIQELKGKHIKQFIRLNKLKQKTGKQAEKYSEEHTSVSTASSPTPS